MAVERQGSRNYLPENSKCKKVDEGSLVCDATSVRTCRYFAQPYSLIWELLLVWVGPLLRGWPYISQSKCNEVRDPGYCIGSLHPILVFHKETNCRQNFCFISNLAAIVPTLSCVSFFFSCTCVYVCVLSLPALVGKNNSQHLFHLL